MGEWEDDKNEFNAASETSAFDEELESDLLDGLKNEWRFDEESKEKNFNKRIERNQKRSE